MSEEKKMTYLEYQDGGRSSFAECCRILPHFQREIIAKKAQ